MKKSPAAMPFAVQEGFAEELDRRVTQRTAELTAVNEQLKKELAERKRAEEAAREGALNLDLIVNSIPVPVAVTSPTSEVEALNQPTLEYFGRTFEELKGWKSSDVVHPDDLELTVAAQMEAHQTGHAYNVESRHRRADGTYRWFNVLGLPLRDTQGRVRHWFHLQIDIDDRKRAEEALRSVESNLNQIINTIPAHIYVLNTEGAVQYVNQAVMDYTGLSLEDVQQVDYRDRVIHPEDFKRVRAPRAAGLRRGAPFSTEQRVLGNDGQYRWFLVHYKPLLDEQGRIVRWYVAAFDIEDGKRAEGQSRRSELHLAEGQRLSHVGSWAFNSAGFSYWSSELFRIHGLDPSGKAPTVDEYMGLVHPDDREFVAETIQRMFAEHRGFDFTKRIVRPDREIRRVRCVGVLGTHEGSDQEFVGTGIDVTEQDQLTEELRRSEVFLAEAQRLSSTGSFSWRLATDEITWSDELYRIYELDPETTITFEVIRTRVHPEDISLFEKMVEQARIGSSDFEWHYRLLMPDQSIKYMHAVAQAMRDPGGELEYIAAVRDVTARRLSEEALDKARSELAHVTRVMTLGALTASIAHEVNQPLSGIITNASTCVKMLDADPPNVDGARETAKRTIRDGRRAADVITRLRALFSKKDAATELVDLNEATLEVIALSLNELERNRVIPRTELADELPLVTGDRVQLQQVIINLLRNGSDAMSTLDDRPRELLFRTEVEEGNWVRLSVRDTGVGFESQTLDRLFQSFYTTKPEGMGIGLSVSRSIIENHRGRIWVTPNDGPGVTFSFSLPCVDDGPAKSSIET